jgi:hypoxanthine phosphoribosyltransferase
MSKHKIILEAQKFEVGTIPAISLNPVLAAVVSMEDYHSAMVELLSKIDCAFDCIVALKRSGWIMGAFLSNQTGKPVFTPSEIKSLPEKYKSVLIVDDKIWKGKELNKVENKLRAKEKSTYSACLYVEGYVFPDYHSQFLNGKIVRMWYEHHCG